MANSNTTTSGEVGSTKIEPRIRFKLRIQCMTTRRSTKICYGSSGAPRGMTTCEMVLHYLRLSHNKLTWICSICDDKSGLCWQASESAQGQVNRITHLMVPSLIDWVNLGPNRAWQLSSRLATSTLDSRQRRSGSYYVTHSPKGP